MTGVGLEPTPLKCLVPKTWTFNKLVILSIYCNINCKHVDEWYKQHVCKIQAVIVFIGMSKKDRSWTQTDTTKVTGALNQRLRPLSHPACMF